MDNKPTTNHTILLPASSITMAIVLLLTSSLIFPTNHLSHMALAVSQLSTDNSTNTSGGSSSSSGNIPDAKSVYDTGTISLPSSVSGFIIDIPDEAHHPITDNKTISLKNAHYIPSNLIIPSGFAIAFVHGDPQHIHSEIIKDTAGNVAWQTIAVSHPGGSDIKVLRPGSYNVSDAKYPPMEGTIRVQDNMQSNGNLVVVGALFCPTGSIDKYKSDLVAAGFQVLSEHNFLSKVVQKDIAGPTTLLIYSTNMPMQDAITNLKPIIASLPYR
jgi:hypothetical protein